MLFCVDLFKRVNWSLLWSTVQLCNGHHVLNFFPLASLLEASKENTCGKPFKLAQLYDKTRCLLHVSLPSTANVRCAESITARFFLLFRNKIGAVFPNAWRVQACRGFTSTTHSHTPGEIANTRKNQETQTTRTKFPQCQEPLFMSQSPYARHKYFSQLKPLFRLFTLAASFWRRFELVFKDLAPWQGAVCVFFLNKATNWTCWSISSSSVTTCDRGDPGQLFDLPSLITSVSVRLALSFRTHPPQE